MMKKESLALATFLIVFTSAASYAQDSFVSVPSSVTNTIGTILPESSNAGAAYLSQVYSPNLVVSETATVSVTFLWEGAGYRNTLGYFTYRDEPDGSTTILSSDLLIPDASFPGAGTAATGDTYDLKDPSGQTRIFQPGERVGFFVVADGWNREPRVQSWDPTNPTMPANDPVTNSGFGRGCFTTLDALNPEWAQGASEEARHVAMIRLPGEPGFLGGTPFLIVGFEDLWRTANSDEDFNDLVFTVSATPFEAIENTPAFAYQGGDPDGDGVAGLADHYPNDPERAFVTRYPTNGETALGFEDQYPGLGDADYNDVVLAYHYELVTAASGDVKDVQLTAHLVARGAGYDHAVGLHLPGVPAGTTGTLDVERFLSDDASTVEAESLTLSDFFAAASRVELLGSTRAALPSNPGASFTNTQSSTIERAASSVRATFTFDQSVAPTTLGTVPYDLFVSIRHGSEQWDVHRPGWSGFEDRPSHLPVEEGATSFIDDEGRPWLLEVPTSWRFPMERVRIWTAYPDFGPWATSLGASNQRWYERPSQASGVLGFALESYLPSRAWSVGLPQP